MALTLPVPGLRVSQLGSDREQQSLGIVLRMAPVLDSPHTFWVCRAAKTNPEDRAGLQVGSTAPMVACSRDAKHTVILKHLVPFLGTGINY